MNNVVNVVAEMGVSEEECHDTSGKEGGGLLVMLCRLVPETHVLIWSHCGQYTLLTSVYYVCCLSLPLLPILYVCY